MLKSIGEGSSLSTNHSDGNGQGDDKISASKQKVKVNHEVVEGRPKNESSRTAPEIKSNANAPVNKESKPIPTKIDDDEDEEEAPIMLTGEFSSLQKDIKV